MAFEAHIIVMAPDVPDVTLVAEIRSTLPDLEASEDQLKRYMFARKCALAMLVTPDHTRI